MKNFTTLSSSECLAYYPEIIKNAESKFRTADKIAEHGDYGTALSTQIIGLEELIKAVVLFADGKGFEFRKVKGMNSVFKNHGLRYLISFFLFVFSVFGEALQEGIDYIIKKAATKEGLAEYRAMMTDKKEFFDKYILPYFKEKLRFVLEELAWYRDFDKVRQLGFYSDFKEELHNPINIDKEFYLKFMERLERVKKIVFQIIKEMNMNHPFVNEYLPKTIEDCKKNEIYGLLALLLEKTRSQKKDALTLVSEHLGGFLSRVEDNTIASNISNTD